MRFGWLVVLVFVVGCPDGPGSSFSSGSDDDDAAQQIAGTALRVVESRARGWTSNGALNRDDVASFRYLRATDTWPTEIEVRHVSGTTTRVVAEVSADGLARTRSTYGIDGEFSSGVSLEWDSDSRLQTASARYAEDPMEVTDPLVLSRREVHWSTDQVQLGSTQSVYYPETGTLRSETSHLNWPPAGRLPRTNWDLKLVESFVEYDEQGAVVEEGWTEFDATGVPVSWVSTTEGITETQSIVVDTDEQGRISQTRWLLAGEQVRRLAYSYGSDGLVSATEWSTADNLPLRHEREWLQAPLGEDAVENWSSSMSGGELAWICDPTSWTTEVYARVCFFPDGSRNTEYEEALEVIFLP